MTLATARPTRTTTNTARYAWTWAAVWGEHPVLVRLTDGLMVPCTHTPPRRGEPDCALPNDWANTGDRHRAWAKPLGAGRYPDRGTRRTVTRPDVVAAADAAFAAVDARRTAR